MKNLEGGAIAVKQKRRHHEDQEALLQSNPLLHAVCVVCFEVAVEATMKGYHRIAKLTLEEVLPHLGQQRHKFVIGGRKYNVRTANQRLLALARSQTCACCGIKGTHFWLECSGCMSPHFNLYATNEHGDEVLMTIDHILPRSKGGETQQDNLQTLCTTCNGLKKNETLTLEQLRKRRDKHQPGVKAVKAVKLAKHAPASNQKGPPRNKAHELQILIDKYRPLFAEYDIGPGCRANLVRLLEFGQVHPRFQETVDNTPHFQEFLKEAASLVEKKANPCATD